ncbi:MAG: hypothetical protein NTU76_03000 [Candidatus Taylorbacteria bacterium]|nr:hypothetical protein [Candidatus Taylorbacteria bacterium]
MNLNNPSLSILLIAFLSSARSSKRFYEIIRDKQFTKYNERSINVAISRLHKNEYIGKTSNGWIVTDSGLSFRKKFLINCYISSPFNEKADKNTIIAFDISEKSRKIRGWLRNQLKIFGYSMLQQSVWFGPGPLPNEFFKRVEGFGIRKNIKIFTVKKSNN